MRKISILLLAFVMAVSFIGCRRKENKPTTETTSPTTRETTSPSTTPETEPIIETNIPDPTVDSNSNSQNSDATVDSNSNSQNNDATESTGNAGNEDMQPTTEGSERFLRRMMR